MVKGKGRGEEGKGRNEYIERVKKKIESGLIYKNV